MKEIRNINILAIESSCDETAAAVVHNGRKVLSNIISSQIDLHKLYGGVVPEIASRKHIEKINQVIEEALKLKSYFAPSTFAFGNFIASGFPSLAILSIFGPPGYPNPIARATLS